LDLLDFRLPTALAASTHLTPGLDVESATDVLVALQSHETLLAVVVNAGWSPTRHKAWLYRPLCQQLLAGASPAAIRDAARAMPFGAQVSEDP
jgi:hypothetical protein